jgi:hypothetical protein
MKATLTIDFELEGSPNNDVLEDALLSLIKTSVVTSEEIDGTEDWVIFLNSVILDIEGTQKEKIR